MTDRQRVRWAAGVLALFLLGLFGSKLVGVLEFVQGKVNQGADYAQRGLDAAAGARKAAEDAKHAVEAAHAEIVALQRELSTLQGKVRAGTATQEDVARVEVVVERIRVVNAETSRAGPAGTPGPPGPAGQPGTPGEDVSTTTTTSSTTTRPRGTTTTAARCLVDVDAVVRAKLGC